LFTKPHIYGIFFVAGSLARRGISWLGGKPAVPIRPFLEHNHAFDPEDVKVLVGASEDTLLALNLTNRQDPLAISVAKLIIEFAKEGERDPNRLRDLVLKTLRPE
jgi:hypothetical protein